MEASICWGSWAKRFSVALGGQPSLRGLGYSLERCSLTNLRSVFSEYDSRAALFCFRLTAGKTGKPPHVTRRDCRNAFRRRWTVELNRSRAAPLETPQRRSISFHE